jgi:putative flippase GtrA
MKDLLVRHQQVLVFICGGLLSAAVDIGVMQFFIMVGSSVPLGTTLGFASGLMINYVFHAKITFQRPAVSTNFVRYTCLVGFNYLLTLGCVNLAVWLVGSAVVGKLASLPLVAINGFLLGKYWIFK